MSGNSKSTLTKDVTDQLLAERGDVVKVKSNPLEAKLDRDGLEMLRRLSAPRQ
ncbi:hypothetical protein [Acinetobacter baumannii]|nr:hypothetical protein [Acinetobacter baumannii]